MACKGFNNFTTSRLLLGAVIKHQGLVKAAAHQLFADRIKVNVPDVDFVLTSDLGHLLAAAQVEHQNGCAGSICKQKIKKHVVGGCLFTGSGAQTKIVTGKALLHTTSTPLLKRASHKPATAACHVACMVSSMCRWMPTIHALQLQQDQPRTHHTHRGVHNCLVAANPRQAETGSAMLRLQKDA